MLTLVELNLLIIWAVIKILTGLTLIIVRVLDFVASALWRIANRPAPVAETQMLGSRQLDRTQDVVAVADNHLRLIVPAPPSRN